MACAADHEAVAKLASVRVLESFPKVETEPALFGLCLALRAALAYCDRSVVERVVGERLGQGGMEDSERSCWLVAGHLTSPSRYREEFRALAADEEALKWLANFLSVKRFRLKFRESLFCQRHLALCDYGWSGIQKARSDRGSFLVSCRRDLNACPRRK